MFTKCPKCGYQEIEENIYYQRGKRYEGLKLGKSKTSMQNYGCHLMAWSYAAQMDPIEVNKLFIENGVYNYDMIISEKAAKALNLKWIGKFIDINYMPKQEITIKEVRLGKGQHFVVRINKDGKRTIFDPWEGKVLPINYYPFKSYRVIEKK